MSRAIVPISQLNRRAPEAGRIRLGVKGAKGQPESIDTFRFTSPDETLIHQIAGLYGGRARPWSDTRASQQNQFEVITTAKRIDVLLAPNGLSVWYEQWSGGGCVRRCDGIDCTVPPPNPEADDEVIVPCMCARQGVRSCSPYTRLQVILPTIAFAGVWRLETKGWNAVQELPGMFDLITEVSAQGRMVQAVLSVERRTQQSPGRKKRNFVVPKLSIAQSLLELSGGSYSNLELGEGVATPALGPAASFDVLAKEQEYGDLVPSNAGGDDDVADGELVDDELLAIEADLRADARNFGLDPDRYARAVVTSCAGDRDKMRKVIGDVRGERFLPLGFQPDGRVAWKKLVE